MDAWCEVIDAVVGFDWEDLSYCIPSLTCGRGLVQPNCAMNPDFVVSAGLGGDPVTFVNVRGC